MLSVGGRGEGVVLEKKKKEFDAQHVYIVLIPTTHSYIYYKDTRCRILYYPKKTSENSMKITRKTISTRRRKFGKIVRTHRKNISISFYLSLLFHVTIIITQQTAVMMIVL